MASDGPDLSTLASWQDAFDYPIATTRRIERQLRADISGNKERLRTLVGASFRDLLNTAERITHLDDQMKETEAHVVDMSRNCNLDIVNKKARHVAQSHEDASSKEMAMRTYNAQMTLLQKCIQSTTHLLKLRGSILLAAKILAVSRLLYKTLSQTEAAPPFLDHLRKRVAYLRGQIVRRVEKRMASQTSTLDNLVEALCAFCLITNSSSDDAVRHFHHLRLQEIRGTNGWSVLPTFQYFITSLQMTKAILGRQLSEALRLLQHRAILQDPAILKLDELSLDVLQNWIAVEVRHFIPFIKHTDPTVAETEALTKSWSEQAFAVLTTNLKQKIDNLDSPSDLLDLRRKVFESWLPVSASTPTHSSAGILEALRTTFNIRMKSILHTETGHLVTISSTIKTTLSMLDGAGNPQPQSRWDENFVSMPIGRGALTFKEKLAELHCGTTNTLLQIAHSVDEWILSVVATRDIIQQLRKTRWLDIVEENEDDDEGGDAINRRLQIDDPDLYAEDQTTALHESISKFEQRIENAAEYSTGLTQSQFLLRLIREVHQRLSSAFAEADLSTLRSIVPKLHQRLAEETISRLFRTSKKHRGRRSSASSSSAPVQVAAAAASKYDYLWEGEPRLPVQPSPRIFKLLCNLCNIMAELGPDLWTGAAVAAVKQTVQKELLQLDFLGVHHDVDVDDKNKNDVGSAAAAAAAGEEQESANPKNDVDDNDSPTANMGDNDDVVVVVNGDGGGGCHDPPRAVPVEEEEDKRCVQVLFDALLLDRALLLASSPSSVVDTSFSSNSSSSWSSTLQTLKTRSKLRKTEVQRMEKRASQYWTKTSLLFGLLLT